MEFKFERGVLTFNKVLNNLDKVVLSFVGLLKEVDIKYVIVSGYVAVFLGRTRTTEDIDMFVEKMDSKKFDAFFDKLVKRGYWIINTEDKEDAFDLLESGMAIRIAEKGKVIPNFEIKFPKKDLDMVSFQKPLKVIVNKKTLFISPLEVQIPYKIWLGSKRDIEDAVHMYELFKGKINMKLMASAAETLGIKIEMDKYDIC